MQARYELPRIALSGMEKGAHSPSAIVIALHGGGYSAGYWDFAEHSLLDRAAARGMLAVAVDRPGYGLARDRPMPLLEQSEVILDLADLLRQRHGRVPVLIAGHSMGAILALKLAALPRAAGTVAAIDASGVPLRFPPEQQAALKGWSLPDGMTHFPAHESGHAREIFFGTEDTFETAALDHDQELARPIPLAEMPDAANCPDDIPAVMRRIALPVRLTLAEQEKSSLVTPEIAAAASEDLSGNPASLVRFEPATGHNISMHRIGGRFHDGMLDWFESIAQEE